jgi:hypothetical protein
VSVAKEHGDNRGADAFEEWLGGFWPLWKQATDTTRIAQLRAAWNAASINALGTPSIVTPAFPTHQEIIEATQLYRSEINKRMDTSHPSASPSIESMTITLRDLWLKLTARSINVPPIVVSAIAWKPWDGTYEKQFYDVRYDRCKVQLHCWPNAGKMVAMDGSGLEWEREDAVEVRVSEFQSLPPSLSDVAP